MAVNYGLTNIGFKMETPDSQKISLYEELMQKSYANSLGTDLTLLSMKGGNFRN